MMEVVMSYTGIMWYNVDVQGSGFSLPIIGCCRVNR